MLKEIVLFALLIKIYRAAVYEPNWPSLDSRPLPDWYDEGKFGIFMHWGVYSVPANGEWFWWKWKGTEPVPEVIEYMKNNYKPGFTYADFAPMFTAEFFNASTFRKVVEDSGAKYYVFTSKHHEGFTMWPSNTSWNWNSVDTGPHRDIIGELKTAFRGSAVHFGLYFSQFEWFNRLNLNDGLTNRTDYVEQVTYPQMLDLVTAYQPDVVWSDGDWVGPDSYWRSKEFLTWLYNDSPVKSTVVVNDRWGVGTMGEHGGFLTFADHFDPGHLVPRKWENAMTMDSESWGYRRAVAVDDVHTVHDLIVQLTRTIACGGNLLLNVGPDQYGIILPIYVDRLRQMGDWLRVNGEAVYGTKPWIHQNDSDIWYTSRLRSEALNRQNKKHRVFNLQTEDTIVYAFVLQWPQDDKLYLPAITTNAKSTAQLLGVDAKIAIYNSSCGTVVDLSSVKVNQLKSSDAWVVKFQYLNAQVRDPVAQLQMQGILDGNGLPTTNPPKRRQSEHLNSLSSNLLAEVLQEKRIHDRDASRTAIKHLPMELTRPRRVRQNADVDVDRDCAPPLNSCLTNKAGTTVITAVGFVMLAVFGH